MKKIRWGLILYALILIALLTLAGWQLSTFLRMWTHRGTSGYDTGTAGSVQQLDQWAGILRPMRIYASSGEQEGRSSLVSDQTQHYEALYEASWLFFQEVLSSCEEVQILDEIHEKGAICRYEYALDLDAQMVRAQTEWMYAEDFSFQEVWMIPAQSVRENAHVYLINRENSQALKIESTQVQWQSEINTKLLEVIGSVCSALGEKYLDASYTFPDVFHSSFYMRDQAEPETKILWQVVEEGEFTQESCQEIAARFFDYPDLMQGESYQESAWIFTDDRCTVRIQENGMIDYVKTLVNTQESEITIAEAYDIAFAFLEREMSFDEYPLGTYLCSVEKTEEGYLFCWNYKADDLPVIPTDGIWKEMERTAAIQIEIQGQEVYRYSRWRVQQDRNLYRPQVIAESVIDALNRFSEYVNEGWENLEIVCLLENGESVFYWELTASGVKYYERVQV